MQYPPKFPNEACAAVEAELIRAGRLHDKRKREWESDWTFPERQSLLTCILSIFLAYAREAIALGKSGVWRVDQVRQEAMEGLRLITIEMSSQKGYHSFLEIGSGYISTETHRELETAPEWRQFEDELLGLAEQRAAKNSQQTAPIAVIPESAQTAIAEPPSWKDLQAEFLQYAVEHADLRAVWSWVYTHDDQFAQRPPRGQWTFSGGLPASQHLFKEVTRRAAQRAPNSSDAEPWQRWLDVMRSEGYSRKLLPRRVSMHEFRVAVESGEYAPLPPGFESQQIEHVFKSSADFCYVRSLAEATTPKPSRVSDDMAGKLEASTASASMSSSHDRKPEIGPSPCPDPEIERVRSLADSSIPGADGHCHALDFTSEAGRNRALDLYTNSWKCSEASLARTASVDPADLSKWKRDRLPPDSDKKARIERALQENDPPTRPDRRTDD